MIMACCKRSPSNLKPVQPPFHCSHCSQGSFRAALEVYKKQAPCCHSSRLSFHGLSWIVTPTVHMLDFLLKIPATPACVTLPRPPTRYFVVPTQPCWRHTDHSQPWYVGDRWGPKEQSMMNANRCRPRSIQWVASSAQLDGGACLAGQQ
jgi:hypothetical protein